jgi:GAF domain-containing protein
MRGVSERARVYANALARLELLLDGETDWVAAMATVASELHHAFDHFDWTGFYRVTDADLLVVGPYQGTLGCQRIESGRGVCGTCAAQMRTVVVADVREFPGHIACDEHTRSEIVVPVVRPGGSLMAVLDVDSRTLGAFGSADVDGLEGICRWLGEKYANA